MRVCLLLAFIPFLALASPVTYSLDPGETELVALTHPAGLLGGMAHTHVIAARNPTGSIVYDADAPERSRVEVRLSAAALDNDDPALRRKYGLEGTLGEEDRRKVGDTMRSASQLDVGRHPDISFVSRSVKRLEGGRLEVSGQLGIHGVEAAVTVPVTVTVEGGVLRGQGTAHLDHHMFGMRPYSAGMGTIRNANGIELRVSLVGRARSAPAGTAATASP
jgi:polyisoprenoid-binding protein YceI